MRSVGGHSGWSEATNSRFRNRAAGYSGRRGTKRGVMEKRDHTRLAQTILEEFGLDICAHYRKEFLTGNVRPDKNPITYLHGFTTGQKFHGHHFGNIVETMKKMFRELQEKTSFSAHDYLRLGKLAHYAADAFTFPHNYEFTGTIREHCAYEAKLHLVMEDFLQDVRSGRRAEMMFAGVCGENDAKSSSFAYEQEEARAVRLRFGNLTGAASEDRFEQLLALHKEYLTIAGTQEIDCRYILRAGELVLGIAAEKLCSSQSAARFTFAGEEQRPAAAACFGPEPVPVLSGMSAAVRAEQETAVFRVYRDPKKEYEFPRPQTEAAEGSTEDMPLLRVHRAGTDTEEPQVFGLRMAEGAAAGSEASLLRGRLADGALHGAQNFHTLVAEAAVNGAQLGNKVSDAVKNGASALNASAAAARTAATAEPCPIPAPKTV